MKQVKLVGITVRATMEVPDDQDLDELAMSIRQHGLGPEDVVRIDNVLVTDGTEDGDD